MSNTENKGTEMVKRRSFTFEKDGETKTFYIDNPTADQIRKSNWHYSKVYNKALVEGISTRSEIEEKLLERGIIGPEYYQQLQDAHIDYQLKIAALEKEEDEGKKRILAREAERVHNEIYRLNVKLTGPTSHSCESMAEDAKMDYLTSAMIRYEDGTPVWESYDEFLEDSDPRLTFWCKYQVMLFDNGLEDDFLENTPERKAMKKLDAVRREKEDSKATKALEEPKKKTKATVKRASKAKAEG